MRKSKKLIILLISIGCVAAKEDDDSQSESIDILPGITCTWYAHAKDLPVVKALGRHR